MTVLYVNMFLLAAMIYYTLPVFLIWIMFEADYTTAGKDFYI